MFAKGETRELLESDVIINDWIYLNKVNESCDEHKLVKHLLVECVTVKTHLNWK